MDWIHFTRIDDKKNGFAACLKICKHCISYTNKSSRCRLFVVEQFDLVALYQKQKYWDFLLSLLLRLQAIFIIVVTLAAVLQFLYYLSMDASTVSMTIQYKFKKILSKNVIEDQKRRIKEKKTSELNETVAQKSGYQRGMNDYLLMIQIRTSFDGLDIYTSTQLLYICGYFMAFSRGVCNEHCALAFYIFCYLIFSGLPRIVLIFICECSLFLSAWPENNGILKLLTSERN